MGASSYKGVNVTPPFCYHTAYPSGDTIRWAVWLGRYALEKLSRAPKGSLTEVRNLGKSARAKGSLTGFRTTRNPGAKAWPSDPLCPH